MEAQLEHPSMKSLKSTVKPSNLSIVDTNYGIVMYAINGINDINIDTINKKILNNTICNAQNENNIIKATHVNSNNSKNKIHMINNQPMITEYQKESRKRQIKCNISDKGLLGGYKITKTPSIPIINDHNNGGHEYTYGTTPETICSAHPSYSNPKFILSGNIIRPPLATTVNLRRGPNYFAGETTSEFINIDSYVNEYKYKSLRGDNNILLPLYILNVLPNYATEIIAYKSNIHLTNKWQQLYQFPKSDSLSNILHKWSETIDKHSSNISILYAILQTEKGDVIFVFILNLICALTIIGLLYLSQFLIAFCTDPNVPTVSSILLAMYIFILNLCTSWGNLMIINCCSSMGAWMTGMIMSIMYDKGQQMDLESSQKQASLNIIDSNLDNFGCYLLYLQSSTIFAIILIIVSFLFLYIIVGYCSYIDNCFVLLPMGDVEDNGFDTSNMRVSFMDPMVDFTTITVQKHSSGWVYKSGTDFILVYLLEQQYVYCS